jgi:hypothetical protein
MLKTKKRRGRIAGIGLAAAAATAGGPAWAAKLDLGPGVDASITINVKYSAVYRAADPDSANLRNINGDDATRSFDGFASSRFDTTAEFDIKYQGWGARVSGNAFYDSIYHQDNDNTSLNSLNQTGIAADEFSDATQEFAGGPRASLRDLLVFGRYDIGEMPLTFRVGRFAQLWGESLFFGSNGIAGAMAPADAFKASGSPGSEFKDIVLPVAQLAGTLQISDRFSVSAYYQFEWRKTQLAPVGSYFSTTDILDKGGERLLFNAGPPGSQFHLDRADDIDPPSAGNSFGVSATFRPDADFAIAIHALQYNAMTPTVYLAPTLSGLIFLGGGPPPATTDLGDYMLVYPEKIKLVGASLSTSVDDAYVGVDVNYRWNMPLNAGSIVRMPGQIADNDENPLYPVGRMLYAQASYINVFRGNAIWDDISLAAEIAGNYRIGIDENEKALNPAADHFAAAIAANVTTNYYRVTSGLNLAIPLTVTYGLDGTSSDAGSLNGVREGMGNVGLGLRATYDTVWQAQILYNYYIGEVGDGQAMSDRDYVSFYVTRSF